MRNYVIINGVNSLTIQGLAIKTMPPITKPIQRTLREEIDGRDGDIVTTLGYGAYDKTIEIGLFGTFDIDEVIAYFNQKGTITFSNEADKVYYFEALDQVDYAELLKFRTANVVLHCQPFKYPTTETPIEVAYEYVEDTGESLTLDNTEASSLSLELKGNTSQVTYTGKNKIFWISGSGALSNLVVTENSDKSINITGTPNRTWANLTPNYLYTLPASTWTFSINQTLGIRVGIALFTQDEAYIEHGRILPGSTSVTFTTTQETTRFRLYLEQLNTSTTYSITNLQIQLETGTTATSYEPYVGGIPSPNPNYPQDIEVVTGDNEIEITGRNLWGGLSNDYDTSGNGLEFTNYANGTIKAKGTAISGRASISLAQAQQQGHTKILPAGTYTLSGGVATGERCQVIETEGGTTLANDTGTPVTFTTTKDYEIYIRIYINSGVSVDKTYYPQLERNNEATPYEAYQSQTYPLTLGNLEMCNIGTYEDYFEYDNEKWYKKANIGKKVFDGTEAWTFTTNGHGWYISGWAGSNNAKLPANDTTLSQTKSNYFTNITRSSIEAEPSGVAIAYSGAFSFKHPSYVVGGNTEETAFKNWLSTNTPNAYYILATETSTEITDTTLKGQLNNIREALSYSGQTNITQTNDNKPFRISASALKKGSDTAVVNNTGNIYSKPTIELEGTGVVNIYKDGTQAFEVDLSEENNITIDTDKMEAYTDTSLANRKVTGDYSKFKLDSGTSNIKFDGALTSATITNYKRWL